MQGLDAIIDAGVSLSRGGRKALPLQVNSVRNLEASDLLAAAAEGQGHTKAAPLKNLRHSHHALAKLLATGVKPGEASIITGISPSRISVLQADPSFADLLSHYAGMEKEGWDRNRADMRERLRVIGFDALETLHERLEDTPEAFDNKTLLAIVEASADRTGHGKSSTVHHDHGLSEETLRAIRESRDPGSGGREDAAAEAARGDLLRFARLATENHSGAEAPPWIEGEGHLVREEGGEGASAEVITLHPLPVV